MFVATSLHFPLSTLITTSPILPPDFRLMWYTLTKTDSSSFALLLCSDERGIRSFVARDMLLVFGFFTSSSIILGLISSTNVNSPLNLKLFIPFLVRPEAWSPPGLSDNLSHSIYSNWVFLFKVTPALLDKFSKNKTSINIRFSNNRKTPKNACNFIV